MSDTVTASIIAQLQGTHVNTLAGTTGSSSAPFGSSQKTSSITDGTTTGKADKEWSSKGRTLVGTTSETISLYNFTGLDIGCGAGQDDLGNAIVLAEVVALFIFNQPTSVGNLIIGGQNDATAWKSPFTNSVATPEKACITLPPGAGILLFNVVADPAYAVVSTTNEVLKIASTGNVTYDMTVLGRSA